MATVKYYNRWAKSVDLTDTESKFYERVWPLCNDSVQLYYNHEHDEAQNQAKGFAISVPSSTPIGLLIEKQTFSARWFGTIAALPIRDSDITNADAITANNSLKRISRLQAEGLVVDWREAATGISDAEAVLLMARGTSVTPWRAGLNGHGHFIAKMHEKKPSPNGVRFWLIVHSDAGPVGDALNRYLNNSFKGTLGDFLRSQEYNNVMRFARENASRNLAAICDVLALNRETLNIEPDFQAHLPEEDSHAAPPDVCRSDRIIFTHYNILASHPTRPDSVVYYNHSTPLSASTREVVLLKNPHRGAVVVQLDVGAYDFVNLKESAPGPIATPVAGSVSNPLAGIPIGLGKNKEAARLRKMLPDEVHKELATTDEFMKKENVLWWHGKSQVLEYSNWRLHAYNDDDPTNVATTQLLLGPKSKSISVRPIAEFIPRH